MLRKAHFFLLLAILLIFLPVITYACNFTWSVNGVSYQCDLSTHEYIYVFSHSSTAISGSKTYFHRKDIKHVSSKVVASMPDASVWIETGETERCTIVTIPEIKATCIETGMTSGTKCSVCEHIVSAPAVTAKKSHTIVNDRAIPASCTETGLTAGTHCSVCKTVIKSQTVVPATGHSWSPDKVIVEPTIFEPGVIMYACSSCTETKEEDIPPVTEAGGTFGKTFSWHLEVPDPTSNECTLFISGEGALPIWTTTTRPWQYYLNNITNVVIEDGITSISKQCFYSLPNTVDFSIADSVNTIDESAFYNCTLGNMTFPNGVTNIHNMMFYLCDTANLQIYLYPNGKAYKFFYDRGYTSRCHFLNSGSSGTVSWVLSEDGVLTYSGEGILSESLCAQADMNKVTTIVIEEGITGFSGAAFYNYNGLHVYLPQSLVSIGNAFDKGNFIFHCDCIFGTDICTDMSRKGSIISSSYPSLMLKQMQNEDLSIELSIINCTCEDNNIVIPRTIDGIPITDIRCWLSSPTVESIRIEANVSTLPDYVFSNCPALKSISLSGTLTAIPEYAFNGCVELETIQIPTGVSSIGRYAFCGCSRLTEIAIPAGVVSIPQCAFGDCSALMNIVIPNTVTYVGEEAFRNCSSLEQICFSAETLSIGKKAFCDCCKLSCVIVPPKGSSLGISAFYGCSSLVSFDIPYGVEWLATTFQGCTNLTSVTIPSSVYQICASAFANCINLSTITLPDNITLFEANVFDNCTSLMKVIYAPGSKTAQALSQEGFFYTYTGCIVEGNIRKVDRYYPITDLLPKPMPGTSSERVLDWEIDTLIAVKSGCVKYAVSVNGGVKQNVFVTVDDPEGTLSLPAGTITVEDEAFCGIKAQKVIISNSCNSIGNAAFSGSNIVLAVIPSSVTIISDTAFQDCPLLTVITDSTGSAVTQWCDQHNIGWYVK